MGQCLRVSALLVSVSDCLTCCRHYNYKYFYLFIVYALLTLVWVVASSFINFMKSIVSHYTTLPLYTGRVSSCLLILLRFRLLSHARLHASLPFPYL